MNDNAKSAPLERYLQIVECVAAAQRGVSLTQIAELTALPKPTVYRLTRALQDTGLLVADDAHYKTFRIGRRLWRLLYLGQSPDAVAAYAQVVCDDLAGQLGETCYIVRLAHLSLRSIARSAPDQGHRLHVLPGDELPPHAASSAKAILAHQDAALVDQVLSRPLPALTAHTKTDPEAVKAELAQVRRDGFALCDREIDDNVMAYACPVMQSAGGVIFSIGVTGPRSRMTEQPAAHWVEPLAEAAQRFARMLETARAPDSRPAADSRPATD